MKYIQIENKEPITNYKDLGTPNVAVYLCDLEAGEKVDISSVVRGYSVVHRVGELPMLVLEVIGTIKIGAGSPYISDNIETSISYIADLRNIDEMLDLLQLENEELKFEIEKLNFENGALKDYISTFPEEAYA